MTAQHAALATPKSGLINPPMAEYEQNMLEFLVPSGLSLVFRTSMTRGCVSLMPMAALPGVLSSLRVVDACIEAKKRQWSS
jgi:hypothetical protein